MAGAVSFAGRLLSFKLRNKDSIVTEFHVSPALGFPSDCSRTTAGSWRVLGCAQGGVFANDASLQGRKAGGIQAQASTLLESVDASEASRPDGGAAAPRPISRPRPGWRQAGNLASRWREVAGESNWEGLLDPLDADLKREILRFGDFIWPLYDAIDQNTASKYRGSALYHPTRLLDKVNLHGTGYTVTKYLYMLSDVDIVERLGPFFQLPTGNEEGDFWSKDSNWVGYIAVASDEEEIKRLGRRDIIIAFRGTHTAKEWMLNVFNWLWPMRAADDSVPWTDVVKVEAGFFKMYTGKSDETIFNKKSVGEQVHEEVRRLIHKYQDEELSISIAGHSLGGALGVICAYELAHTGVNKLPSKGATLDATLDATQVSVQSVSATIGTVVSKLVKDFVTTVKTLLPGVNAEKAPIPVGFLPGTVPITVFTFGSPRAGNDDFRDGLHALGVKVLRVQCKDDIVPKLPGFIVNEWHVNGADKWLNLFFDSFPWTYIHVGALLEVDHKASPYLEDDPEFMAVHDLEVYLHLLAGFEHAEQKFNKNVHDEHGRSHVTVNKYGSLLKPEHRVPEAWYQVENKGIFQDSEGRWRLPEREEIDKPEYFPETVDPEDI